MSLLVGELTAQDTAVIIGACAAAFTAVLGALLKVINEIRKTTQVTSEQTTHAQPAVRPDEQPTLRALVESIDGRIDDLRSQTRNWHAANTHRIDRLADAVGGVNRRLDNLERQRRDETHG